MTGQHIICPYCNGVAEFVDSQWIYGRSFGMVYCCFKCDAYVGVHKGTNKPLGTLANKALRDARQLAHAFFDHIWKSQQMTRTGAYDWLSKKMEKAPEYSHIAMFNEEECARLVGLCKEREKKLGRKLKARAGS